MTTAPTVPTAPMKLIAVRKIPFSFYDLLIFTNFCFVIRGVFFSLKLHTLFSSFVPVRDLFITVVTL